MAKAAAYGREEVLAELLARLEEQMSDDEERHVLNHYNKFGKTALHYTEREGLERLRDQKKQVFYLRLYGKG